MVSSLQKMTRLLTIPILFTAFANAVQGFVNIPSTQTRNHERSLWYSKSEREFDSSSSFDSKILEHRIQSLKIEIIEEEQRRPPNTELSPKQLIEEIMYGLLNPYDPLPDAGFRLLLKASTKSWQEEILHSIGASGNADIEIVASALGTAIGRPHNQFAILVGEGEDYKLAFSEPADYEDGTCWIQCTLRENATGELLVIMGWDLCQQHGAWLVHRIDWQDFRDEFRPGIGREEWSRECH
jgi:hypothetical protein